MKKVFALMAIAATVMVVSCKKGDDPTPTPEPGPEPTPTYVQPITIDGDFSDWAKLPAAKMAIAECPQGASKTALKLVKVFADEMFIFVYFEWDKEQITHDPTPNADGDPTEAVPFHVYLNGDGLSTTGGFGDQWTDACTDVLMEGFIYPDGESIGSYEPGLFKWTGEVNGTGWSWEGLGDISGITAGAGIEGKYELSIMRELYPLGKIAEEFSIGFDIQQGWDSVGILPIGVDSDENPGGHVASLQVKTNHAN